ncbi:hypothetical protein, partial [Nocardioides sp. ChNu-153]|uniref:hypothetical protein n=2 Tax=unclassified Nocardioides TaxID=2615069 RepID=UPI002658BCBA
PLAPPAPPVPPAAPPPAAPPPAAPPPAAPGELVDPDRAAQLVGMVLEDTARSRASYESSTQFADRTLEAELERIVGDPALRLSAAGDAARAAAQARRDDLVARARQAHVRDLATLRTEVEGLERTFPAALARWDVVATRPPGPGDSARAFRAGHLTVPGLPDTDFALPMVLPVPARPVLVTTDDGGEGAADRVAALLGVRAALAMRTGRPRIVLVDLARTRGSFGLPPGLAAPSVTTPPALTRLLGDLERRTALVDAAREAGAFDALDPQVLRPVVVVLADAPTGWETPALTTLARLVRGGTPGVQLVLTGPERPPYVGDEAATELARQVWASALHLPSAPGGSLVDAFARTEWTFVPEPGPADPSLLVRVLASEGPLEGWHDGIIPVP